MAREFDQYCVLLVRPKYCPRILALDGIRQWLEPRPSKLLIARIIRMNAIASHSFRIEPSPRVYDCDGAVRSRLGRRPSFNRSIQGDDTLSTLSAVRRAHGNDLRGENLHCGLRGAHLVYKLAECGGDLLGRVVAPDVVRTEVHHDDVGFGG